MLALGRALMSEPALLMLDEPSLGLAPAVVDQLYDALYKLHEEGLTLLLAEQSIPLALAIADYAYVLQTGRTVLEGTAEALENNEQVQEIYLGIKAVWLDPTSCVRSVAQRRVSNGVAHAPEPAAIASTRSAAPPAQDEADATRPAASPAASAPDTRPPAPARPSAGNRAPRASSCCRRGRRCRRCRSRRR